jgi:hypothetical protein
MDERSKDFSISLERSAIREEIRKELQKTWEQEAKKERMAAARKQGREIAKRADQNFTCGRNSGILNAASFFIGKGRADIAQALLTHFMIDRDTAKAALEADKRTRSLTLAHLDKAGVWREAPKAINL